MTIAINIPKLGTMEYSTKILGMSFDGSGRPIFEVGRLYRWVGDRNIRPGSWADDGSMDPFLTGEPFECIQVEDWRAVFKGIPGGLWSYRELDTCFFIEDCTDKEALTTNLLEGEEQMTQEQLVLSPTQARGIEASRAVAKFVKKITAGYVGMENEIEKVVLSLLTKEHILLKGRAGLAKSALLRDVINNIKGAKVFSKQLSKDMTPSALYGSINIKKLKDEGLEEYNTANSIIDCDFAFLDEVYDCNDMTLRSILEVLNERIFTKNGAKVDCPLHSCFMASNYKRDSEVTEAFNDRILLQREVTEPSTRSVRISIYKNHLENNCKPTLKEKDFLTIETLRTATESVLNKESVKIDEAFLAVYDDILTEYAKQTGQYISPRRKNKMLALIKASALLKGRNTATHDDLSVLAHGLISSADKSETAVLNAVIKKTILTLSAEENINKAISSLKDRIASAESISLNSKAETDLRKYQAFRDIINSKDAIEKEVGEIPSPEGKAIATINELMNYANNKMNELKASLGV